MFYLDQLNNYKYVHGRYSSIGRALDCGSKGHGFDSYYLPFYDKKKF